MPRARRRPSAKPVSKPYFRATKARLPASSWCNSGAFSDPANVSKVRARVKESGFGSYTEAVKGAKGEQTRVRAGPFSTREAAEQAAAKLKHAGLAGVVAPR